MENGDVERSCCERVEVVYRDLPVGTEENHDNSQGRRCPGLNLARASPG